PALVGLLLALALVAPWFTVATRNGQHTAALVALVLAMALLGPAPAVALGIVSIALSSGLRRLPTTQWLNNLTTFAAFPLAGALVVRALAGDVHNPNNP